MSFPRCEECLGEESPFTSRAAGLMSAVLQGSEHVILPCPHSCIHLDSRNPVTCIGKGSQRKPKQTGLRECGPCAASCTSYPPSAQGSPLGVKSPPLLDKRTLLFSLSLFSFPLSGLSVCLHAGGPRNITIIVEDPIAGLGASPSPFCVSPPPVSAPL